MSGVDAMLAECKKWVDQGYKEDPGNHTVFGRWYGDDGEPWCDQFASYCGDASGNGAVVGRFQYCPSHLNWFKARGQFSQAPQVGALVFYDWDGDRLADHVGIVVRFDDTTITTYEGNTSSGNAGSQTNGDGAYMRVRPRNSLILGYGIPAYPADSSPAPAPAPVPAPAPIPAPRPAPQPSASFPGEYLSLRSPMLHDGNVRAWQQRMRDRGWSITVDGWFGKESSAVCKAFQSEKGLSSDGIVGPNTWNAAFRTDNVTR